MSHKALYVYIDESGNIGDERRSSRYYLVCFVYADKIDSYRTQIEKLDKKLDKFNIPYNYVHAGLIIRNKDIYHTLSIENRRQMFNLMCDFINGINIEYDMIKIDKKGMNNKEQLIKKLNREVDKLFVKRLTWFLNNEKTEFYYDGGQMDLMRILKQRIGINLKETSPQNNRMLQIADMIATLYSTKLNFVHGCPTHSETIFFINKYHFLKQYNSIIKNKYKK